MAKAFAVHVTAPDRERAQAMARTLVDERLAACVNIIANVRSIYRWKEEIHEDDEVLCLIKTGPASLPALMERVRALHPYEVPEILAFEVEEGDPDYLAWLAASTLASGE